MPSTRSVRARPPFPRLLVVLGLLALAGCAGTGAEPARPGAQAAALDTSLDGTFQWTTFDSRSSPVEYPPGTGVMMLDGTLQLHGAAAAARDGSGRFSLRFTMQRSVADGARPTSEDGRFRIVTDSLLFTPDGREHRPPVRYRYAWLADGTLALTDAEGHVWGYERQ